MTLNSRLTEVFQRMSTQDKALKMLINGNLADLSTLTTTNKSNLVAALNELKTLITSAAGINDSATGTGSTWSSTKITAQISASVAALVNGAPAALDTLKELSDALAADDTDIANLLTAVGNRVRFDAAQTLTAPQQAQARANTGAQAAAEIGNTDTDFVAIFEAGLV